MSVRDIKKWYENNVLMGILFFCLAFLIYSNTLNNDFAGDDPLVVSKNQYVQKGIGGIKDIFKTTLIEGYTGIKDFGYRPVPLALFAIEKDIFGEKSSGHHWMQVLLYGLSCVITFLLIQRMLKPLGTWPIFIATLMFIGHPIHTEVVANIKSRDEILGFMGVIGTLISLLKYIDTRKIGFLLISILSYTIGIFSKESALTALGLIPLTLYFFSSLRFKQIIPIILLYMPSVILYFFMRHVVVGNIEMNLTVMLNTLVGANSFQERIATALSILARYMKLLVVPHPLSMDYSYNQVPLVNFSHWSVWIALVIICGGLSLAILTFRKKNPMGYGFLFMGVSFSLTSNLFILVGTTMSERLLFTPSFGFCLVASLIFFYMREKSPLLLKRVITPTLIIILIVLGLKSHSRNRDWKNDSVLIPKTFETSPESGRVQSLMGSHYYNLARQTPSDKAKKDYLQRSITHFLKSIEIYNQNKFAYYELGFSYKEAEDYDQAIDAFLKFCELDSTNYRAWLQLGICYSKIEQYDKALQAYNRAENLNGDLPIILYNTGYIYRKLGQFDRAVAYFNKALEKNPGDIYVLSQLVKIYRDDLGDIQKAMQYNNMIKSVKELKK